MKLLIILSLMLISLSCSSQRLIGDRQIKKAPEHTTEITDPQLKIITDEYFRLSMRNKIVFTKQITIGLSNIKSNTKLVTIGLCTYGKDFREVDFDTRYWLKATWLSKVALVYHELTHAYCNRREHDYADGKIYPDPDAINFQNLFGENFPPVSLLKTEPGYFEDGCPLSIMYPTSFSDDCFKIHYSDYIKEMFQRCDPY